MDVGKTSPNSYRPENPARVLQPRQSFSDMISLDPKSPIEASPEEVASMIWHDVKETSLSDASDAVRSAFEKLNSPDRPEGLTDQEWMTQLTASMGATDSIYAYLALAEQNSPESYKSGKSPDVIKMNFEGHIFTHAVKILDMSSIMVTRDAAMFPDLDPLSPAKS
ncbi:hypothetical protein [Rhizobium sp. C4]|uniref:hypothetical protein n=1 Tax=Rhizobium sp. C4 TaxID=1349800 RepID=UPI001E5DA997|nr:hypothetical protein [Rhizobium sp. C4]MCD2173772.1 hypothetical protein [Rhizobium sp. C4]